MFFFISNTVRPTVVSSFTLFDHNLLPTWLYQTLYVLQSTKHIYFYISLKYNILQIQNDARFLSRSVTLQQLLKDSLHHFSSNLEKLPPNKTRNEFPNRKRPQNMNKNKTDENRKLIAADNFSLIHYAEIYGWKSRRNWNGEKCTAALLECDKTSSQANGRKTAYDMKTHNGEMKYVECENSKNVWFVQNVNVASLTGWEKTPLFDTDEEKDEELNWDGGRRSERRRRKKVWMRGEETADGRIRRTLAGNPGGGGR